MVDLIPKAKIPATSGIFDSLMIGTVKSIEERALAPVIGNGTAKSGIIKLFGGSILSTMLTGKTEKFVSGAMVIDGVEDIVNGLIAPAIFPSNDGEKEADDW